MEALFSIIAQWVMDTAHAAPPPIPDCSQFTNLFGCGGASNVLGETVIPNVAIFFLRIVATGSVLFVIWSGVSMMLSMGDSGKAQKAKMSVFYTAIGLAVALSSQMLVGFVSTENYGQGEVGDFIVSGLLRNAIRILMTLTNVILGLVITISGFRMVMAQGKSDEFNSARSALVYAVLGAIIVNASLVIIRVVTTFIL
jgi:hypothetical protein